MAHHRIFNSIWIIVVFSLFLAAPSRAAEEESILVLDASGSMWGQIDDEAKITIAKRVLDELLDELPSDRLLGLIAYGHNRKGDCGDIEELAPIGSDRSAISDAVKGINPKGKTPMIASVTMAAEKLRYTEERATVILISDGIETCAPDPCAAANALEQTGVDFTAHVIGFGVSGENEQAQLRCIAENTGGRFVLAANAGELSAALQETMAAETAQQTMIALRATELEGGLLIESGLAWRVSPSAGGDPVVVEENAGRVDAPLEPGEYDIAVTRESDGLTGEAKGVVLRPGAAKTVTIALTFPVEATIRVEPEGTGVAGAFVKVYFEGPERQGDFISIAEKESSAGATKTYSYVSQGAPAELRLPVEPGVYEIRYVLGRPYRVLVSLEYEVTPATATLSAPETAIAGEEITVAFTGPPPGSGDYITITKPEAEANKYNSYAYTKNGSPAEIRMPLEAGVYEIRYIQGNTKIIATQTISIVEAPSSVAAPQTAIAGETVSVVFTGPPAGAGDFITVTAPGAPQKKYNDYAYTKNGSPAEIRMPLEAGAYEIRYVQNNKKVIATQPITLTAATATLDAPGSGVAGDMIAVRFTGPPAGSGDYIAVSEIGAPDRSYKTYSYTAQGSPLDLRLPNEAGEYELRFIQANKKVLARQPITVRPAQ